MCVKLIRKTINALVTKLIRTSYFILSHTLTVNHLMLIRTSSRAEKLSSERLANGVIRCRFHTENLFLPSQRLKVFKLQFQWTFLTSQYFLFFICRLQHQNCKYAKEFPWHYLEEVSLLQLLVSECDSFMAVQVMLFQNINFFSTNHQVQRICSYSSADRLAYSCTNAPKSDGLSSKLDGLSNSFTHPVMKKRKGKYSLATNFKYYTKSCSLFEEWQHVVWNSLLPKVSWHSFK